MVSYNQIIVLLKAAAEGHRQLKSFREGDLWDIGSDKTIQYPAMWVTTQEGIGRAEIDIQSKKLVLTCKLLFLDKVLTGKANEVEVKSDMLLVATDIISQLQQIDWIQIENNLSLEPFTDAFDDQLTGWEIELNIRLDYLSEYCALPSNFQMVVGPDGISYMVIGNNFIVR